MHSSSSWCNIRSWRKPCGLTRLLTRYHHNSRHCCTRLFSLTHSLTQMRQVYLIQDYLSDGQLLIKLRQTNNFVLRWESEAAVFNKDQEFGSSRSSISGRSSGDVRAAFQASRGTETAGAAQTPEAADGGNKLRRSVSDLGRMLDTHTKQYEGAAEARQVVSQTPLIGQAIACRCVGCSKSCPSTSN